MSTLVAGKGSYRPRTKLRKGTRSCTECRRRKVRCIFEPGSRICQRCVSRHTECTEQEFTNASESSDSAKVECDRDDRELKNLLSCVLQKLNPSLSRSDSSTSVSDIEEALEILKLELLPSTAAVGDLWPSLSVEAPRDQSTDSQETVSKSSMCSPSLKSSQIALLSVGGSESLSADLLSSGGPEAHRLTDKERRVIKALRALTPNTKDLSLIIQQSRDCWDIWSKSFPDILGGRLDHLEEVQSAAILTHIHQTLSRSNSAEIVKVLLCLALSFQQLPANFDIFCTALPASRAALQDHYLTSAETFLASDEGIACTVDGLDCMTALSRFYAHAGKPRKAWLIFRRAISLGHLLGLHRQPGDLDSYSRRRRALWLHIVQGERFMSLILGLPSATSISHFDLHEVNNKELDRPDAGWFGSQHLLRLSVIAGHILDRNQDQKKMDDFLITMQIDQELQDCASEVPQSWWEASTGDGMDFDAVHSVFLTKFWYHNIRRHLHQPFIFQPSLESRHEYSRLAALDSSRELIHCFQVLRYSPRRVLTVCNVVDYEAFSAAMTLIIDLLGYSQPRSRRNLQEEEEDWRVVLSLKQDLELISTERPCSVATQAARLLEFFFDVRQSRLPPGSEDYEVVVPYLGKIRVERGTGPVPSTAFAPTQPVENLRHTRKGMDCSSNLDDDLSLTFDSFVPLLPAYLPPWDEEARSRLSNPDFNLCDDWGCFPQEGRTLEDF